MALTGVMAAAQLCIPAARLTNWKEIRMIMLGAAVVTPLGIYTLIHLDPELVRRAIGGFVLIIALILATG